MTSLCIDFETANSFCGSICAAGAVMLDGEYEADFYYSLVKPHPRCDIFAYFNKLVHGIDPSMVASAPEFGAIYDEKLRNMIVRADLIFAHSASFDMTALKLAAKMYQIELPRIEYSCTVKVSRKMWPELHNHKLSTVCDSLGFEFMHHNALQDAEACARILIAAMRETETANTGELIKTLGINRSILVPAT